MDEPAGEEKHGLRKQKTGMPQRKVNVPEDDDLWIAGDRPV
jgi:hypothetical protein